MLHLNDEAREVIRGLSMLRSASGKTEIVMPRIDSLYERLCRSAKAHVAKKLSSLREKPKVYKPKRRKGPH